MVKKRLIFTLLYADGYFMLSRNFRLQKAGDINWIRKNYNFQAIASHIDELIVLDVSRADRDTEAFCKAIGDLVSFCFMPVSAGGGIVHQDIAEQLFAAGADKLVVNSALYQSPDLVKALAGTYGSQSLIASLDCKREEDQFQAYIDNGQQKVDLPFVKYLQQIADMGIGEIYLNSMDKDGTGQGYDLELLDTVNQALHQYRIPLIMAGGAGNSNHLLEALSQPPVDAVATANIFNFIGNALPDARQRLLAEGMSLARW